MSVASKKRRRAKRGGILGHLGRIADMLKPYALNTPAARFADAVDRGWPVYAHPDTASAAQAAGLVVVGHPMMERGVLFALKPATPIVMP